MNWLSEAERTTELGSAFQLLIPLTAREFLLTLEVAGGFLSFIPWPLVVANAAGAKN